MNRKPNVIVFFTDQQRWDTMEAHGNPLQITPNLDRMARMHTHVYNSFTCQPVCGPARSCLQTGQYATTTGCYTNGIPLADDAKTLAHYFQEDGYNTGYIGKWHLSGVQPHVPEGKRGGYDYWLASELLEFTSDAYDTVLFNDHNDPVKLPGYRVDALTDAAVKYIDTHQDKPFFLFVSYLEPHHQNHIDDYPAPEGYREQYTGKWCPPDLTLEGSSAPQHLGGYFGMVKRLDEAYGRIHDTLKSLHLSDDTIVLFTSDHGNHFKTRNAEYKRSGHESSIRVPTVFTGSSFKGGGQIHELVSLVDLPPTLLDAAGIQVPSTMEGRSILPLINREATDWPKDIFVQISESQNGRAIRTKRWKYGIVAKENTQMPFAETYLESYLYDLEADPYELTNIIESEAHREVIERMRFRMHKRIASIENREVLIEEVPRKKMGQRKAPQQKEYLVSDL
ncbi:sulfatase-like hydrolase/transferase [Guptibacillus hwajinpoensis]|uniref:sulfatase-like hydrolase/transferase n=1 Tax=Guptibacillus hwajinpoensis TaxID=208199 RepID=UPI001CD3AA70|nr:sulfatase-like hydrolase/transferase [Pseudalkalibacillus hwajinpoensis]MCA0991361.1 sulfatase-like hydrolase/transferase [Pseudalkalibacillus hwajinpoensis]